MALDPSIALGIKPIEVQNPLNQFAQAQQIQAYQRQNELANRAIEQEDALNRAYASSMDPATGQIDANKLRQNVAGANLGSKLPAVEKSLMETRKLGGEVDKLEYENKKNKYERSISDIINFDTHDQILGSLKSKVDSKELDLATAERLAASVPQDPRDIPAWQIKTARGLLTAKDRLEQQFTSQDFGGGTRVISTNKYGGGPAQVVQGSQIAKTATIADQLARQKFDFEKANPGFELKEAEDGSIVGVNKRTLQAFPVTIGGGAAPAAGGAGAAPAAGGAAPVPLKGKGTALTESQGNATAFGMRMLESDKLLRDLEKGGTTSGGRIKGAVEGTLNALVPFQGEKLAEGAGAVMNVLPGVMGGPNENQQMYEQAKKNFITAVLRKESGASIAPSEFATEEKKYFPQAGESDKVIAQKQRARDLAIQAMKIQAGPGAKNIGSAEGEWAVVK